MVMSLPLLVLWLIVSTCTPDALEQRWLTITSATSGTIGVAAMVVETGETIAAVHGDDHFPMQSVYKLPIAMAALQLVDRGTLSLDQQVRVDRRDFISRGQHSPLRDEHPDGVTLSLRELLRLAVADSDGTASDVVMRLAGGPAAIDKYLHGLGIDTIKVIDTEQAMGRDESRQYRNWATPRGAVALLRALQTGRTLSDASRALLQQFLTHGSRGAKRIAGLLPADTIVAHKPGTSGTDAAGVTAATNDIGLVSLPDGRHLAVAVFVTGSHANDADRDAVIARIAQAAWKCVTATDAM
jgi:beta-lactamase class A